MSCEYCLRTFGHDSRCPNYIPKKAKHYCSICEEGILDGEEYIENDDGEYAHWECVDGKFSLADWLKIRIMKE